MEQISYKELPTGLIERLQNIEALISTSKLDIELLELIKFRVSQINDCAYCLDMHFKEAIHHGISELKLYSLSAWRETNYYTDKEKVVLEYAENLTLLSKDTDKLNINKLLEFFNKEEISYIALTITQINTWNRLMKCFRFEPGKYQVHS